MLFEERPNLNQSELIEKDARVSGESSLALEESYGGSQSVTDRPHAPTVNLFYFPYCRSLIFFSWFKG